MPGHRDVEHSSSRRGSINRKSRPAIWQACNNLMQLTISDLLSRQFTA